MASRQFLSREEWAVAARRRLGTDALDVVGVDLRPLGAAVPGFLGEHRLVDVTVQLRGPQSPKRVLKFFLKAEAEAIENQREMSSQSNAFLKEVDALSALFVDFRSVLQDGGKGMEWTCQCFYTRPDVIVLEDLVDQGFRVINGRIQSDFQHCAAVLRALANLHAASLIFEETRPVQPFRLGARRPEVLRGGFFQRTPGHPGAAWLEANIKSVWRLVEEIRGAEALRVLKAPLEEQMNTFFDLIEPSERFRNVVCHGDPWRNNMLFRELEDGQVQALLVDFQLLRYAPPALDVMWFLHFTTERAFRRQHGGRLLALYHEQLSRNLARHGLRAEVALPWEEFRRSCDVYNALGAITSPCYTPITHIKGEDLRHVFSSSAEFARFVGIDRIPEVMHAYTTDSLFREKITEVIEELIEVCVEKKSDINYD